MNDSLDAFHGYPNRRTVKASVDVILQKVDILQQNMLNVQNKKEEKMDQTSIQRKHLYERARDVQGTKWLELRKLYRIDDDEAPKTMDDLLARLKDGKFVFDNEKYKDREFYYASDIISRVRWRDPNAPADKAGFAAAEELLNKAFTALTDEIIVSDPKDALEALKAFEAKSFQ